MFNNIKSNEVVENFLNISKRFMLVDTMQEVYDELFSCIESYIGDIKCILCTLDENKTELSIVHTNIKAAASKSIVGEVIKAGPGIINWAVRNSRNVYIEDVDNDVRYHKSTDKLTSIALKSLAVIPFLLFDDAIGALVMLNPHTLGTQNEEKQFILKCLSELAALAIIKTERIIALERAAMTDSLTQHYNRRGFTSVLENEVARANRYQRSVALMMIDIDNFKNINDVWGHLVGDKVLLHFSNVLRESARKTDFTCRYGGDEFIVLLPDTSFEHAFDIKQRIESTVKRSKRDLQTGYSVSIGVYANVGGNRTVEELLQKADEHLYEIKREKAKQIAKSSAQELSQAK